MSAAKRRAWPGKILCTENGRTFAIRPGGTGGFSSFFAFDRAAKHGVVLLSDTALTDVGGLRRLGLHLLDPSLPVGIPRNVATAEVKLIDAREAAPFNKDIFVIEPIGAEVAFERDAGGKVIALTDRQRGQVLRGERH